MAITWRLGVSVIFIVFVSACLAQKYTICTPPENFSACEQLNRSTDIVCVLRKNPINCLLMVENGEAAFTSVSAEEALLASSLTNNLVVLAEFISKSSSNHADAADFETVILMRTDLETNAGLLNGAKFCHPGVDINKISPYILKEFEMNTLLTNNIQVYTEGDNKSFTELYFSGLNEFFGISCRPGRWSIVNRTIDDEFKRKYPKLWDLCRISAYQTNQQLPFLQSLSCLLSGEGDLALTTMNTLVTYNQTQFENPFTNYSFLCKNGDRIFASNSSCVWTRQPWPLLIGHKNLTVDLPTELRNWFVLQPFDESSYLQLIERDIESLKDVIYPRYSTINVTFDAPSLASYITGFRERPTSNTSKLYKSAVNLCVLTGDEEKKCKWLRQAALNYGIQPVLECIAKDSNLECLKALQSNIADVTVVDSNMTYAVNRQNLSILGFGEELKENMRRTVLVVNTTTVKTLRDLEGKSGFFSEYGDIAWLAFADTLRQNIWSNVNYYGEAFSNFLGSSCMPGVLDVSREPNPINIAFDKVCSLCGASTASSASNVHCNADYSNYCYGNDGALRCLGLTGDFAVITMTKDKLTLPTNTSIMCRNGTLALNLTSIDDDCALSMTINDVIVVRKSDSKNIDIELMLQEFDVRFAAHTYNSFKIFDLFGSTRNLIFKDTTMGVEIASITTNKYANTQWKLFENIPKPKTNGSIQGDGGDGASFSFASILLVFTSLLFVLQLN